MEQREFVAHIRRLWGVDLAPSADPALVETIDHLRKSSEKALELLSSELYSSETHFFLEVLQNADDNAYEAGREIVAAGMCARGYDRQIVLTREPTTARRRGTELGARRSQDSRRK